MPTYRTALNDFVLDQIGFVECKLHEAVRDAASQISAITEASGVVPQLRERMFSEDQGPVAELVGIEGGVVSGVFNLESSDVGASDRRPRHEERYHEV
jgi:hypothetical protein